MTAERVEIAAGSEIVTQLRSSLAAIGDAAPPNPAWTSTAALASVNELRSAPYQAFMTALNSFAAELSLHRTPPTWTKCWEYPWVWFNGLRRLPLSGCHILDIGPANRPVPWALAALGAHVTLVELYGTWLPQWEDIRECCALHVDWELVIDERLPFADASFDIVTSLSVLEHQPNKVKAVDEIARVLRAGGLCAVSCDICEEAWGMSFPSASGRAISPREFEQILWRHPAFEVGDRTLPWSEASCAGFLRWHSRDMTRQDGKYVVAAACLRRAR
jgi:2-polyprenyl-3-methyl-5-hydroxy-6-metoxy-1,4-benzoquinol methylase